MKPSVEYESPYKNVWELLISSFVTMSLTNMDKCFRDIYFFLLCVLVYECCGLNCRSGSDNKEQELQRVYNFCQRRYAIEKVNNSQSSESSKEWFGVPNYRRTTNYRYDQNQNQKAENEKRYGTDIDRESQWRDEKNMADMRSQRDQINRNEDRFYTERTDRFAAPINDGVINRPSYSYTGIGNGDDRNGYGLWNSYSVNRKDNGIGVIDFDGATGGRQDPSDAHDVSKLYARNDEMLQPRSVRDEDKKRRFKRSRAERNSGSRTQYNPNTSKNLSTYYDDAGNDSQNKSNKANSSNKACALHCYLDNLGMTTSDGLPDKYLVTHVLTKDVTGEDLRDFLIESIEECFQILENEHTEEKCEFSKNLLMCLSEKGKANCDDWRDDASFKVASH